MVVKSYWGFIPCEDILSGPDLLTCLRVELGLGHGVRV